MSRIRIPVSERITAIIFMTFTILFILQFACERANAADLRLVIANTADHHFSTVVLGANDGDQAAHVSFDSPQCHNYAAYDVAPQGAIAIKTAGLFCSQFLTVPAPPLRSFSLVSFSDGKTTNSFALPPVGTIDPAHPARLGPVVSDDDRGVYVTLLPSKPTPITVELYDSAGKFLSRESFTAYAPVTQYKVVGKLGAGSVSVRVGWVGFGAGDVPSDPVYGFVTNASSINSNAVAYPFP